MEKKVEKIEKIGKNEAIVNGHPVNEYALEAVRHFEFSGTLTDLRPFGNGHINDTYLAEFDIFGMGQVKVIVQRMNRNVFKKPEELMENVVNVTEFLKKKIEQNGGDPSRETLNIILSVYGKPFYVDSQGEYWRAYKFITGASCYDLPENPQQFYESAYAFGHFQQLLSDYPAETLYETIPGFHDTRKRYEAFEQAVKEDSLGRAANVQREIAFIRERKELAGEFMNRLEKGELSLRVTHNDTKLNNVMIDDRTQKGICVIDLDTVMPGLVMNDFGDSIRFGASTATEDETDLSLVSCSMELFETYTKGFLKGCGNSLTPLEIELLAMGAKMMTYENGIRFLTDYLQGDVYFKIARENHNLDRCRTQLKLIADMEAKWDQMQEIVQKASVESQC